MKTMISPKKLLEMARKGQKVIAQRTRRTSFSASDCAPDSGGCSSSTSVAEKGHFVVYSIDGIRCVVPLASLGSPIFTELLKMSEEEFGLPSEGPITLPCTGVFLEYVASMIKRSMSKDVEKALLVSIFTGHYFSSSGLQHGPAKQNVLLQAC
ncbi:hypothetical protein ACLOJK_002312 [Asimina triloba]